MEGLEASSVSTSLDTVDFDERNFWNPMLELLFHVQVGGILEIYVEEIDLASIALSCHSALDLPRDKPGLTIPLDAFGTTALGGGLLY